MIVYKNSKICCWCGKDVKNKAAVCDECLHNMCKFCQMGEANTIGECNCCGEGVKKAQAVD